ncbi:STAS domain-containing protein [Hymenobacter wooponensis]|uniref:STAS domain-containing protein n=1 Tax=Hymenobacter wooponensis TaxID=1525360 RepID=A0A4Z0MQ89_9BACT|nr:STAS domain-containing protein [Hymenobacter wooponensis]TGD81580.1 STAS domain-containing protein [Hymenobacter wooponensis]
MEVYREILPQSYLLILTDSEPDDLSPLSHALRLASRSGKNSIWIDCSHMPKMPFSVLRVLVRTYRRLRMRNVSMVLCHVGDAAHQQMAKLPTTLCPPVVPSLLDAERYCQTAHPLQHRQRRAA